MFGSRLTAPQVMTVATSSRRRLRTAASGIAVLAGIGAISLVIYMHIPPDRSDPNCKTVRDMINYTRSISMDLSELFLPGSNMSPSVQDYKNWAERMHEYAAQVKNTQAHPHVSDRAQKVAADSEKIVDLFIAASRDRSSVISEDTLPNENPTLWMKRYENPPSWMTKYNQIAEEFDLEVDVLDNDCPA